MKKEYLNFTEGFANAAYISIALVSAGVIYVGNKYGKDNLGTKVFLGIAALALLKRLSEPKDKIN
jgi:hypothetical protein